MPPITREISGTAGLFTADEVATKIWDSVCAGDFSCFIGMDGWIVGLLTAGMAPETNPLKAILQFLSMGILRLVSLGYQRKFDGIVAKMS